MAIHVADPDAFFLPLDGRNEQYEALVRNPLWHFYGKDFPSKDTLLGQRNDVIARHPKTTFVGLHVANRPENLAEVTALLDRYPNLYVEFGARLSELGRWRIYGIHLPDAVLKKVYYKNAAKLLGLD